MRTHKQERYYVVADAQQEKTLAVIADNLNKQKAKHVTFLIWPSSYGFKSIKVSYEL